MTTLAKLLVALGIDATEYHSGMQTAANEADSFGEHIKNASSSMLGFVTTTVGMLGIANAFSFVKDSALGMNATLETSTLQFTTLMGSSDQAEQHVKNLFKFAKDTPFETQPIIDASAQLQVFGGNALNTLDNLTLFGDAAAATTKPLQDISFWSGRMYAALQAGKPIGEAIQNLQQLGIIAPETINQLENMQEQGKSGAEMWKVYSDSLKRFGGAMALQADTWQGLSSSISDSSKMLIATGFRPLFEEGKSALRGILKFLGDIEASGFAERFAQGLQIVIGVIRQISQILMSAGRSAYAWGQGLAQQYAEGIASAVNAIISIIQQIGSVIASWLQLSSPPKAIPLLDRYGADAATFYAESWKKGDFSALETIGGIVQSTLKGLVDTKQFGEQGVVGVLLGSQGALARGISEMTQYGTVTDDTFNAIVRSLGPVQAQLSGVIRSYFDLQTATYDVDRAQDELNNTMSAYDALLTPLNSQMKALQDQQQQIRDTQRLAKLKEDIANGDLNQYDRALALNEINQIGLRQQIANAEKDKDAAVKTAQAKVSNAQQVADATQQQYDRQVAMVNVQNKQNDLLGQQIKLMEQIAKTLADNAKSAKTPLDNAIEAAQARESQLHDMQRMHELQKKLTTGELGAYDTELARNEVAQIQLRMQKAGVDLSHDALGVAQDQYDEAAQRQQELEKLANKHSAVTKKKKETEDTPIEKQLKAAAARESQLRDMQRMHDLQQKLNKGELGAVDAALARNEIEQIQLRLQKQGVDYSDDSLNVAQDEFEAAEKKRKELEKLAKQKGGGGGAKIGGAGAGMSSLTDTAATVGDTVGKVSTAIDTVKARIDSTVASVTTFGTSVKDTIIGIYTTLVTIFQPAIDSTIARFLMMRDFVVAVWGIIQLTIDTYGPSIVTSATNAFNALVLLINTAVSIVNQIVTTIFGGLIAFLNNNSATISAIIAGIIKTVFDVFTTIANFASANFKPILAGIVAVILYIMVPAFIAWAAAAYATAAANIAALAPILIPLALIGIAVALLYQAWNTNFLGIRDLIVNIWTAYLLPTFITLWDWLQVAIPAALQTLSDFWTNILQPALLSVWNYIKNSIIPLFTTLVTVNIAVLKVALQTLANFWNLILKPAITAVYTFITVYVVPLFKALVNVHIAAISLALRVLAAVWNNVIMPALRAVWNYLTTYINPVLTWLYDKIIDKGLKPALQSVAFFILGTLIPQFIAIKSAISGNLAPALGTAQSALGAVSSAFGHIDSAIKSTISWIQKVADKLNSISIPDWLQGHSPPPMADWFSYIGDSAKLASSEVGGFNRNMIDGMRTNTALTSHSVLGSAQMGAQDDRPNLHVTVNRAPDSEQSVGDEIRMQSMLYKYNIIPG